jgi:hypothetical protein
MTDRQSSVDKCRPSAESALTIKLRSGDLNNIQPQTIRKNVKTIFIALGTNEVTFRPIFVLSISRVKETRMP